MRRGRLSRYIKPTVLYMGELSANDRYACAYYFYKVAELLAGSEDELEEQIEFFFKLASKMKCTEAVSDFLQKMVEMAEKNGKLTRLQFSNNDDDFGKKLCFDYSTVPYAYEEDKNIDRNIPGDFGDHELKINQAVVNLFRCLYVDSEFLPQLIANFLLKSPGNGSEQIQKPISKLTRLPAKIKNAIEDFSRLDFLSDAIELTTEEKTYLLYLYRSSIFPPLKKLMNSLTAEESSRFRTEVLDISPHDYSAILRSSSALRTYGFIDDEGDPHEDTIDCITNENFAVFFTDLVKETDCKDSYKLDSFNVNKNVTHIMTRMLCGEENISLLLYGKPGSGKTEFAKSLAKASGLKPLIFKNEAELNVSQKTGENCVLSRLNLFLSISRPDTVLIIDEADTLLKTCDSSFFGMISPSKTKGTINKMLEANKNKIIWIVNFTGQIDESTLRRFNFSYKFDAMSREQLKSIAQTKLSPLNLPQLMNEKILGLMEKYSVTGASVDNVVKTIKSLESSSLQSGEAANTDSDFIDSVQAILKENSLLINGKKRMRENVGKNYDTKALNASMEPEKIVRMVQNAEEFSKNNSQNLSGGENGIRMLFYGKSGTGKTEFARYISESLGKKILLRRASDILDKYVGGSEQNIRNAFEEADRTGSILLFDEADSFFASRENAKNSWERTQVNEFLTQMEEFGGIIICTTNLKEIMDSAMNRRFHIIVEFKPLDKTGIRCMLEQYFASYNFSDEEISRLERKESVTPGDFGALANRMRFMDSTELSPAYITEELCKMQDEKTGESTKRKIGFYAD
ncbi:MAG: ATP-binding protein [Treponema sp.]|nr:ATP-binding protein [Treponema sp.]